MFRLNAPIIMKRSLYAGVFVCLSACQPNAQEDADNEHSQALSELESSQTLPPLLSLDELLNASDFQAGIKQAVANNDKNALLDWQTQLLMVAHEVRLMPRELDRISGEQGLIYIEFEAKKQLFHDAFVERFMHFEDIDDLITKYPYLTGVHKRASLLISERDKVVSRAAAMLVEGGLQGDATEEARAQWRDYMVNSGKLEQLKN